MHQTYNFVVHRFAQGGLVHQSAIPMRQGLVFFSGSSRSHPGAVVVLLVALVESDGETRLEALSQL